MSQDKEMAALHSGFWGCFGVLLAIGASILSVVLFYLLVFVLRWL